MVTYEETLKNTIELVSAEFIIPERDIHPSTQLAVELQLDSLDFLDLCTSFEECYLKREMNEEELHEFRNTCEGTIEDLAQLFYHILKEEEEANESNS